MANVKVHLDKIIKYVLLLGLGIQIVLGLISCVLWLGRNDSFWQGCKSFGCLVVCGVMSYVFLRLWCEDISKRMLVFAAMGIVSTPIVLQSCMQAESGKITSFVLPIIVVAICIMWRKWNRKGKIALMMLVACVATVLCCRGDLNESTIAARVMNRICYPGLLAGVENIPQDLLNDAGYIELRESLRSAEGTWDVLYPSLLERYGSKEEADAVCYRIAEYGMNYNTKKAILNIVWDYAGYHFPMIISELQLQGMAYDAVTGYNYAKLSEKLEGTTEIYWKYSVVRSMLSTIITIVLLLLKKCRITKNHVLAVVLFELAALCFTMQGAGFFDYTNLPMVQFLWMGCMLGCICEKGQ